MGLRSTGLRGCDPKIADEVARDEIYVIRSSLPGDTLPAAGGVESHEIWHMQQRLAPVRARSGASIRAAFPLPRSRPPPCADDAAVPDHCQLTCATSCADGF